MDVSSRFVTQLHNPAHHLQKVQTHVAELLALTRQLVVWITAL